MSIVFIILLCGCTIDMDEVNYENFNHKSELFFDLNENYYSVDYVQFSKSDTIPFFKSLSNDLPHFLVSPAGSAGPSRRRAFSGTAAPP